jgi:hypothetical protein
MTENLTVEKCSMEFLRILDGSRPGLSGELAAKYGPWELTRDGV